MVASQSSGEPAHNDMYCSTIPTPYGEYYPTDNGGHFYLPHHQHHHPQEMCPQHQPMCTLHGDYGPVTVPMVSTNSSPPIAMPVQVPPGHVVQQIVDENGTLRHMILSPQPPIVSMPPPPPHGHNPPHYGPGPGNGANHQPPQQFYPPQGLPPGYGPPPHFGLPPSHLGHAPPPPGSQHTGHSPPPNCYKDERTHRQYIKLKRKLEQKQMRGNGDATHTLMVVGGANMGGGYLNSGHSTPAALSPRKDCVNGLRRNAMGAAAKDRGMSSVGTSEDGEESSSVQDDGDDAQVITDILSSVQAPQVSELSSRCALLEWSVPQRMSEAASNGSHDLDIAESDLRYEVLLSTDKGKEGKYKSIYSGSSLSCRIQDLRPGQEYSVRLQVHFEELQGNASESLTFTTPPCEPDQPQPPKLISRTRTNMQLRWNAATDNGSHILHYILEFDEGTGGEFTELSKGKGKQHSLQRLQASTCYKFRLAAVNECGKSVYSDIVAFSTSGSPPGPPAPPVLKEAAVTSLHLAWQKRPNEEDFTLQMDDRQTHHGFLPIFNGKENEYYCGGLRRASEFRFRVRAHNEEGASRWSEEVCYRTLPDRPAQPLRPNVKGKIHAHQFKIKWDPPHDKGGADITTYVLEINSGSGYETVYRGSETEAICDRLSPGTTYQLRVYCISAGGQSECSDPCTVTTEAVCPSQCLSPKVLGKPRANSISLRWNHPEYNGGASITEFELEVGNPTDTDRRIAYRGKDTECNVMDLYPGQVYNFILRAVNRVGAGPWSEELTVTSGAAAPDAPLAPEVIPKSPFLVFVQWQEPGSNGAPVSEYRLEIGSTDQDENFSSIFQGGSTYYDVKNLTPFTPYYFRVQACNSAGCSPFSAITATMTPASTPSSMSVPKYVSTPTSITLTWNEPLSNGADILYYNIELGDKTFCTEVATTEYTLENLHPDTHYKIKIQGVNAVGSGPLSAVLKAVTLPMPPVAPKLECLNVGHNYLKLKWGEGKNIDFTRFCVEMYHPRLKEFQCVYQGTSFTCKVNKLQELTTYRFRISAANDWAGQGDFSDVYEFKTCIASPAGVKPPKVVDLTQRTCSLEWGPCKPMGTDPIIYLLQMTRVKDQDYKQIYKGPETKYVVSDLEAGAEYSSRVCPIRQASTGDLQGAFSPPCNFLTPAPEPILGHCTTTPSVTNSPVRSRRNQRLFSWLTGLHATDSRPMSDKQRAFLILIGFTIFAIFSAVLVEKFINWRQSV